MVDSSEEIAKMCVAVEIIKGSNEFKETVNGLNVPLLNHIQPQLHVYWLVFSCEIKHKITYIY